MDTDGIQNGVFITTSKFTKECEFLANKSHKNIVLVDQDKLADLLVENNVGVSVQKQYQIKRIDIDFFEEI